MDASVARDAASDTRSPARTSRSANRAPPTTISATAPASASAGDAQPRHARDAPAQHAVPGRRAGDHHAAQHGQPARELAHRHGDGEDDRGGAHDQRGDRREPPLHRIPLLEHRRRIRGPAVAPARWIEDAERLDLAVYAAIARTPTPALDVAMSRLSHAANYSRLSMASAALLALAGGRTGRRAAVHGLASVAVTSALVNVAVKPLARRRRPDRLAGEVPVARHVRMPTSRSFPSGHSAAAFAFATGVGQVSPAAAAPLRALAALVAYSRVHTGVHYPGDVLAGGLIGTALAQLTTHTLARRRP